MPKFKVCATWEMFDEFDVEADTLEDAIEKVYANDDNAFCVGDKGEYVDDSFSVDKQASKVASSYC